MSSNNNQRGQRRQRRIADNFNNLLQSRESPSSNQPGSRPATPANNMPQQNTSSLGDPYSRPLLKSTPLRPVPGASAGPQPTMARFRQHQRASHFPRYQAPTDDTPSDSVLSNTLATPVNPWQGRRELKLDVFKLPAHWTTWEVYNVFSKAGNIHRIHMHPIRTDGTVNAFVVFRPPPDNVGFVLAGRLQLDQGRQRRHIEYSESNKPQNERQYEHPDDPRQKFAEKTMLRLQNVEVGVMKTPTCFLALHNITEEKAVPITLSINLYNKVKMELQFIFQGHKYRIDMLSTELDITSLDVDPEGRLVLLINLSAPPLVYRQPREPKSLEATHQDGAGDWNESMTWFRQLKIVDIRAGNRGQEDVTKLQPVDTVLDISRWLTYRMIVDPSASAADVDLFKKVLYAFHPKVSTDVSIQTITGHSSHMYWGTPDSATNSAADVGDTSFLSDLQQMAAPSMELPFSTRYQLEVCLSNHILHESNLAPAFTQKLAAMDERHATKLLERAVDSDKRLYDPMDVFKLQAKFDRKYKKVPTWCAVMPAATITPTTIYFHTPVLETSNRVIRTFSRIEDGILLADRFLRVKFTDERYYGRIHAHAATTDLLFAHVKRTMKNGISVAGRHYEFLAFSNSQFRENGALFFASTPNMTADMVREWMGDFQHIPVVAKYAARLGQCLSTTRAMSIRVNIEKIPDINRNAFCFTDGVGKISPFAAQMIAQESGFASSPEQCPSVFQVRIGGAKGILAVDPTLKGSVVALRPSQEKFAARYNGLEICRISQFSGAYLNVQVIPVLEILGIPAPVHLKMLRGSLEDLRVAMIYPQKAIIQLYKRIDYNHMTPVLAHMIEDGFMESGEPFLMSCLHLWRSWEIKYLKEKFKIPVERGAFVIGCVDETATLQGHFDRNTSQNDEEAPALPEIFIQIPEDRASNGGKCEIIEGICLLTRNPCLHPGDIRVVRAVNASQLHHLKNCVVLPQTGDRDLANMCSGGDLDGDDYLVIWDPDLVPSKEHWNVEPMDYKAPPAKEAPGPITVNDITNHYVQYMKHDNLSQIAVQHRLWADREPDGVSSDKCLELALLHSKAVDYPKTGHPAILSKNLRSIERPHWSEPRPHQRSYRSGKTLGQLYDAVQLVQFKPEWEGKFDARILTAYPNLSNDILHAAREVKAEYDESVKRIMAQFEVENEFEVWTTFVQRHTDTMGDYKFSEKFGEVVSNLKQQFQEICYEAAGTTSKQRDWSKMGPFLAAMYKVTANQVEAAIDELQATMIADGCVVPLRPKNFQTMPYMSFPWIFSAELGQIAKKKKTPHSHPRLVTPIVAHKPIAKKVYPELPEGDFVLEPLKFVDEKETPVQKGELLDLFHQHPEVKDAQEHKKTFEAATSMQSRASHDLMEMAGTQQIDSGHAEAKSSIVDTETSSASTGPVGAQAHHPPSITDGVQTASRTYENDCPSVKDDAKGGHGMSGDEKPVEAEDQDEIKASEGAGGSSTDEGEVFVERENEAAKKPSALSRLEKLLGLS